MDNSWDLISTLSAAQLGIYRRKLVGQINDGEEEIGDLRRELALIQCTLESKFSQSEKQPSPKRAKPSDNGEVVGELDVAVAASACGRIGSAYILSDKGEEKLYTESKCKVDSKNFALFDAIVNGLWHSRDEVPGIVNVYLEDASVVGYLNGQCEGKPRSYALLKEMIRPMTSKLEEKGISVRYIRAVCPAAYERAKSMAEEEQYGVCSCSGGGGGGKVVRTLL